MTPKMRGALLCIIALLAQNVVAFPVGSLQPSSKSCVAPDFMQSWNMPSFLQTEVQFMSTHEFMAKLKHSEAQGHHLSAKALPPVEKIVQEAQKVVSGVVPSLDPARDEARKKELEMGLRGFNKPPLDVYKEVTEAVKAKYAFEPFRFCVAPPNPNSAMRWCQRSYFSNPERNNECKHNMCVTCCDTEVYVMLHTALNGDSSLVQSLGFSGGPEEVKAKIMNILTDSEVEKCRSACQAEFPVEPQTVDPPPPKDPELGLSPQNPAVSCVDIMKHGGSVKSGNYWIKVGQSPPRQVYCDMVTDEGGWTMFYAYRHRPLQTYELDPTKLPTDPMNGQSHMHLLEAGFKNNDVKELRFFCRTYNPANPVQIHFKTRNERIIEAALTGNQKFKPSDWLQYRQLEPITDKDPAYGRMDHGTLPASVDDCTQEDGGGFWNAPFFKEEGHYWNIKGDEDRWECDDYLNNANGRLYDTLHQVWFRGQVPPDNFHRDRLRKRGILPPPVPLKIASAISFLSLEEEPSDVVEFEQQNARDMCAHGHTVEPDAQGLCQCVEMSS